jgi:hypothetical protein
MSLMLYGFQPCDIPNVKHMSLKLRLQNSPTVSFVLTSCNIFQSVRGTIQSLPSGRITTRFQRLVELINYDINGPDDKYNEY